MKNEKKAHGIQLLLRCVVRDPDGKLISDTGRKPARSFLVQFLEFYYLFGREGNVVSTNTAGGEGAIVLGNEGLNANLQIKAPINVSSWGVVVGTGDTAEDNEDHKLATQLTQGAGVGNITHGAVTVGDAGVVGANVDMEIKRAFINLTGSAISVKEAGIYTKLVSVSYYHCVIRDVFPGPVNVPDKCSLTVYYTVRTTA